MKRVAVTGAAGQIAYSLVFLIANGDLFGPNQEVSIHLLDLPETRKVLEGVAWELEDCAFPLLKEIRIESEAERAFEQVDLAILIGAKPRGPSMERKDLLTENAKIFVEQGKALNRSASPNVRVLVVGNPCNTNCLIALKHAPRIPSHHFFAMTRLDQNRMTHQLAAKANVSVRSVKRVAIWGNHSSTQVPDLLHAQIDGKSVLEVIRDPKWMKEVVGQVQKRGAAVIAARGKSSAASAAQAILDAVRSLFKPTSEGDWFSMGVYSKGNPYGIDEDLIFSFPCISEGKGDAKIVPSLPFDAWLEEQIALTQKELQEEREAVAHLLKPS